MTYNEINSRRTGTKDKCGTVIDKKAQYCLQGSGCDDRKIRHIKTSSLPIYKRSGQNWGGNPHPRSKNSLYSKVILNNPGNNNGPQKNNIPGFKRYISIDNINWLSRQEVVALLESVGIVCYDSEGYEELKEALRANVEDGTIEL